MTTAKACAAHDAAGGLAPWRIERTELRADDVAIRIRECGVCQTRMKRSDVRDRFMIDLATL